MAFKKIGDAVEVLTLDEAREHLRIEPFGGPLAHPDDNYITALITTSREWCERYLERAIATQEYETASDEFGKSIELLSPIQTVDEVSYLDALGESQILPNTNYAVDAFNEPASVIFIGNMPAISQSLPNPVIVSFTAGYEAGNPCPFAIRAAMLLIIGNLYENRQQNVTGMNISELPMGVESLLQPYRLNIGI
jgi:uncharacterized phiE125 gp8 family phage protein